MSALYVVVDAASRKRLRQADSQKGVEPIAKDEALVVFQGKGAPDETATVWNPAREDFDPIVTPPVLEEAPLTRRELQAWRDVAASLVDRLDTMLR